jgi:hypothetical protein
MVDSSPREHKQPEQGEVGQEVKEKYGPESEGNGKKRWRNSFELRAKVYGLIFVLTMIWSYITEKTGYHFARYKGLYKKHEPKGWVESLHATFEGLPLLIFLFIVVIAGVEIYEKIQRYRSTV